MFSGKCPQNVILKEINYGNPLNINKLRGWAD